MERPDVYLAECVDLDLISEGGTPEEAIGKLQEAICGYLEAAFDGQSTEGLVLRPSPLSRRLRYHWHWIRTRLKGWHRHYLPAATPLDLFSHCR